MLRDVLSKATTLLGRQKDSCLSVRMQVNTCWDFAIFDFRKSVLEKQRKKCEEHHISAQKNDLCHFSCVNPRPSRLGIAAFQDFL